MGSLGRDFCDSRRDRRRNRSMCRHLGFKTLAAGAAEDAIETFAEDSEVFSEETQHEVDMVVEDYEAELEDHDDEDFEDEDEDEDSDEYEDVSHCNTNNQIPRTPTCRKPKCKNGKWVC